MAEKFWAVCQTMPGREHLIRAEIEKTDRGAFLPTYARSWVAGGKVNAKECALMLGYVFFQTQFDDWGAVQNIEGVHRVLSNGLDAKRIAHPEMARIMLEHALGHHNVFAVVPNSERRLRRKNSRKPRPGKRIRARANTGQCLHG